MKRLLLFIFLLAVSVTLVRSQDYDIRKLKWGMSFDEVKKIEGLETELFKEDDLLGMRVDVNFGFDYKGLYAVIYSTRGSEFAFQADDVLRKKYGTPIIGMDYSFIMQSKDLLKHYPDVVIAIFEKGDLSLLEDVKSEDERKLIGNVLSKQNMWAYGNTVTLLLKSPEVSRLSYWSKTHHEENKKKFADFMVELKKSLLNKKTVTDDDSEKI